LCAYVLAVGKRPTRERAARAARLLGAAAAQRQTLGAREWGAGGLTPDELEAGWAAARAALGEKRWAAEVAAGRALSPEQALSEALQISPRSAELPAAFSQIVNRRK
jgi:hypothetical protein